MGVPKLLSLPDQALQVLLLQQLRLLLESLWLQLQSKVLLKLLVLVRVQVLASLLLLLQLDMLPLVGGLPQLWVPSLRNSLLLLE